MQRLRKRGRSASVSGSLDESSHPVAALSQEPTPSPESREHGDEADAVRGRACVGQPAECRPEVVMLALKFVETSGQLRYRFSNSHRFSNR